MPTTAKSNAKSTTRRKPIQSAQERPAAQVVQFPLFSPKPRQTAPQEVQVVVCECSADAVRVRLLPDPAAVWCMMDETFGTLGWTRRYYFADGRLWCGVLPRRASCRFQTPTSGRKTAAFWLLRPFGVPVLM